LEIIKFISGAPISLAQKIAAAKKRSGESEGGQKFLPPPNSLPFCFATRSAAIKIRSPDFRQKSSDFFKSHCFSHMHI